MAAQTGPEAGRQRDPDSLAAQRERESSAKEQLVDTLYAAQNALVALSDAALEGTESVVDIHKAGLKVASAAIDRRLGDLGRWFDRKIGEVDHAISTVGRGVEIVAPLVDVPAALEYHGESFRVAGRVARNAAEDVTGVTALREELASTQRTLAEQAAAAGARATTEVVAAGVDAGVEEPEEKTVRSENGVNVRAEPLPTAAKVDALPKGSKVSLVPGNLVEVGGYAWRKIAGSGDKWVASGPTNAPDKFLA